MENLFRSSRLVYRAIEDDDEDFMHSMLSDAAAIAGSDAGLLKPRSTKDTRKSMDWIREKTIMAVVICLAPAPAKGRPQQSPKSIGCMYLTPPEEGEEHHRNSDISIDIIATHQRRGFGGEAIEWLLDWGFRIAGLHRIGIEHFSCNEGAKRLYERLGFVYEGSARECLWYDGGWHDCLSYSMLEGEWRERALQRRIDAVTSDTEAMNAFSPASSTRSEYGDRSA